MGYRDYFLELLPPWLRGPYGSAWGRALGDVKDGQGALLKERVAARMPTRPGATEVAAHAPTGALEATGRDRRMPRAVGESDAGYAARLADAWAVWEAAGTPLGVLRALAGAGFPQAKLVIRSQRLYKLDSNGELVVQTLPAGSWCFEPEPQAFWSRYAVLFASEFPTSWYGTGGDYVIGPEYEESNPDGATQPSLAVDVTGAPPQDVRGQVRVLVTGVELYSWYLDGVLVRSNQPFYPTFSSSDPAPLLLADGTPSGLQVYWVDGEPYVAGAAWHWDVQQVPLAIPGEESSDMQLIRALVREWANAAAVFDSIIIVKNGGCWGYPVGTWGEDFDTWGGDTVLNYHP